jgi:hypothetical protein
MTEMTATLTPSFGDHEELMPRNPLDPAVQTAVTPTDRIEACNSSHRSAFTFYKSTDPLVFKVFER